MYCSQKKLHVIDILNMMANKKPTLIIKTHIEQPQKQPNAGRYSYVAERK